MRCGGGGSPRDWYYFFLLLQSDRGIATKGIFNGHSKFYGLDFFGGAGSKKVGNAPLATDLQRDLNPLQAA